jgi:hypothetical protein
MVLYPYRTNSPHNNEVPLPKLPEIKESARMKTRESDPAFRPPAAVALGPIVAATDSVGAAFVKGDGSDTPTMLDGNKKRMLFKPPEPERPLLRKFQKFVRKFIRQHLQPLAADTDLTLDHWLAQTDYPEHRKEALRNKWKLVKCIWEHKYRRCKSFAKDEFYPTWKYIRAINSRTDEFKCFVGPTFKAIEKAVFCGPIGEWFIKKIPAHERPDYIMKRLHKIGVEYMATDYTSFEAQFTKEIMTACEFELYDYMTMSLPNHREFMKAVRQVIGGTNICEFKNIRIQVEATRMSGEMCTSLGNGFSNLMFMLFIAKEKGCTDVVGVVEGDDGLFTMRPNKMGHFPTREDFRRLGLVIVPEWHKEISTASFCGIVFAPEDRNNIADPMRHLLTFGWTNRRYVRSKNSKLLQLLRAKALSLAYQYAGCPILDALSKYGLRVTAGVTVGRRVVDSMNEWQRRIYLDAIRFGVPEKNVGMHSRLLVDEVWQIPTRTQLDIERYLESKTTVGPLWCGGIEMHLKPEWMEFFTMYSERVNPSAQLNYPVPVWAPIAA